MKSDSLWFSLTVNYRFKEHLVGFPLYPIIYHNAVLSGALGVGHEGNCICWSTTNSQVTR
ncbi:hypothetical protein Hanom_Chr01g00053091 [Helianthus anomalus]